MGSFIVGLVIGTVFGVLLFGIVTNAGIVDDD